MEINNLIKKTEDLIEYFRKVNPDITHLEAKHSPLIAQIVSNYNLPDATPGEKPNAQMIFLGAPTGSGKDTLIRKIELDNPNTNFVSLNMDMFRHYHNEIVSSDAPISDKDFAYTTNQTSYELYYIIQEIILREFPGTNIIVTGTMRDLDWIKEISDRYRYDSKTNYKVSLATLAVPTQESALSIFERYLRLVDERNVESAIPLRYTDLEYHNDTVHKFAENIRLIEDNFHQDPAHRFFDSIKVYRRNKDIFDISEDTLIYDSNRPDPEKCAHAHIASIMHSAPNITRERIAGILEVIKRNKEYLTSQGLFDSIPKDIEGIVLKSDKDHSDVSK